MPVTLGEAFEWLLYPKPVRLKTRVKIIRNLIISKAETSGIQVYPRGLHFDSLPTAVKQGWPGRRAAKRND